MNQNILDLLYRSFDSELTAAEQVRLNEALAESAVLREEQRQILSTRELLGKSAAPSFKPFFVARLSHKITSGREEQEDFFRSLKWSFRLVGLVGAMTVVLLFAYNSINEHSISVDSLLGLPQVTLEDTWQLDILSEEDS